MKILSSVIDLILAGYVIWEIIQFVPRFRKLKQDIANGNTQARNKIYQRAIVFEWISALLALGALGFDWSKLNPGNLGLNPLCFNSSPVVAIFGTAILPVCSLVWQWEQLFSLFSD